MASNPVAQVYIVSGTYMYSGTSDEGHSVLRTQYEKPLYKGHVFVTQITILSMYYNYPSEKWTPLY